MRPETIAVFAGALLALEAAGAQAYPRTRDSAGVHIVENAARMSAPVRFVLSEKPVLEVGGLEDDPAKEFNQRNGYLRGVMLSDAGLAVIDMNRVHFFDAAGKRKVISGRAGSGPGEFQYITSICRTHGDTVLVSDNRTRRVSVLDRTGAFVRAIPVTDGSSPPFEGCLDDGTFLLDKLNRIPGPNGTAAGFTHIVTRWRLDGTFVDTIGTFDAGPFDMATQREARVFAGGDRVGFADARGEILLETMGAKRNQMILRSADPLQRITDAEREERWKSTIPRNTPPDEVRERMDRMRSMPGDKNWPAHRRVTFDDDGRLWVQDFNKAYFDEHGWTAFDKSGRIIGRLIIPKATKRFEIIGFAKDRIIVMRADEDDAVHISVYAIKSVAGSPR